ncbi:hypothetical protein GCM10010329_27900 [Streptomyces spiroverticillatus]|uniref:Uncharacterized protein n=1 Tax=Streptomyces finlayi TaxID=67296 RepID=A0A919C924_9ACTN|nr:hypothetical protein [Streptomyces finlayi]GHA03831.1 hypothetical protein GCM10010329_27900 [Streptomyces spiroverticillatus]GHC87965.1 hypothetical protein GCM10010334_20310 [Streptomyces finlayi]
MDKKPDTGEEPAKRRIDLSVAQVAGSAVAAVVAAVLASKLGVYGTVIGAGVVSVVATSGGTIFQHFFKRTGEQLREVTVHAKPKGRQPHVDDATRVLRTVEVPTGLGEGQVPGDGEFTEATVHGTRVRGWKRSAIGAAVVFAVAMGGITTYELVSDNRVGGGTGTTFGGAVRGGGEKKDPPADQPPATGTPEKGTTGGTGQTPGKDSGGKQSPDPGDSGGKQTPDPDPTPTPDPTTGTGGTTGDGGTTGGETPKPPPPTKAPDPGGDQGGNNEQSGAEGAQGRQQAPAGAAAGDTERSAP